MISKVTLPFVCAVAALCGGLSPHGPTLTATLEVDVNKPGLANPQNVLRADDRGDQPRLRRRAVRRADPEPHVPGPARRGGRQPGGRAAIRCPIHWSVVGDGKVTTRPRDPVNAALPISLRLDLVRRRRPASRTTATGAFPSGRTPPTPPASTPRAAAASPGPVTASLVLDDGERYVAKAESPPITSRVAEVHGEAHDRPRRADHGQGAVRPVAPAARAASTFSLVSLFPPTYQDTPNGLRPDLMKLMADLQPEVHPPARRQLRRGQHASPTGSTGSR